MSARGQQRVELIERKPALSAIERVLARAGLGSGQLMVVEGAPGIGKTRVLAAARELAEAAGQVVLAASGAEFESAFALGVVRQLFEPAVNAMAGPRREELRGQAAGLALDVLDRSELAVRAEPTVGVLHGLFWLTVELASAAPLVLLVDDAHWSDAVSLRALTYLARRVDSLPVTVIVATRAGAARHRTPLSALLATPGAVFIRLPALSRDGTWALAGSLTSGAIDERAAASCHALTAGNPFLVCELVRFLAVGDGRVTAEAVARIREIAPATLSEALMLRLDALSADALAVAQAVAVLGDDAEPRHVAALAELSVPAMRAGMDALALVGVLSEAEALSFVHPLIRSAVYGAMSASQRAEFHRRAAGLLAGEGAEHDRVATHLLGSSPAADDGTVRVLLAAAARAMDRGAPESAAELLERAVAEPPPAELAGDVLVALGHAELAAGARARGTRHLRGALQARLGPETRVAVAMALTHRGDMDDPVGLLDEVARSLDDEGQLRLEVERASVLRYSADHAAEMLEQMRGYASFAGRTPAQRLALAASAFARLPELNVSAAEVAGLAERAFSGERLFGERTGDSLAYGQCLHALVSCEALDATEIQLRLLLEDATTRGSPFSFLEGSVAASWTALLRGDLAAAAAHGHACLEVIADLPGSGSAAGASLAAQSTVLALLELGQLDDAARLLDDLPHWTANPLSSSFIEFTRWRLAMPSELWTRSSPLLSTLRASGPRVDLAAGGSVPPERCPRWVAMSMRSPTPIAR